MFARRREIEIMKYVGATNGLVTLPFVVEGLALGLISGVLTAAIDVYKRQQYIFSDDNKFRTWRRLWVALARAEMEQGLTSITPDMVAELDVYKRQQ